MLYVFREFGNDSPIISGTKCDRDKPIFFIHEDMVNQIEFMHHRGTKVQCQSMRVPPGNL